MTGSCQLLVQILESLKKLTDGSQCEIKWFQAELRKLYGSFIRLGLSGSFGYLRSALIFSRSFFLFLWHCLEVMWLWCSPYSASRLRSRYCYFSGLGEITYVRALFTEICSSQCNFPEMCRKYQVVDFFFNYYSFTANVENDLPWEQVSQQFCKWMW